MIRFRLTTEENFAAAAAEIDAWLGEQSQVEPAKDEYGKLYVRVPEGHPWYESALPKLPTFPGIKTFYVAIVDKVAQTPVEWDTATLQMVEDSSDPFIKGDHLGNMLGAAQLGINVDAIQQFITSTGWVPPAKPVGWFVKLYDFGLRLTETVAFYDRAHRRKVASKLEPYECICCMSVEQLIEAYYVVSALGYNPASVIAVIQQNLPEWTPLPPSTP